MTQYAAAVHVIPVRPGGGFGGALLSYLGVAKKNQTVCPGAAYVNPEQLSL